MDLIYIGMTVAFGLLSLGFIRLSEKLMEDEE